MPPGGSTHSANKRVRADKYDTIPPGTPVADKGNKKRTPAVPAVTPRRTRSAKSQNHPTDSQLSPPAVENRKSSKRSKNPSDNDKTSDVEHKQPAAVQTKVVAAVTEQAAAPLELEAPQVQQEAPQGQQTTPQLGQQESAQDKQTVAHGHLEAAQYKDAADHREETHTQYEQDLLVGQLPGPQVELPPFQREGQGSQVEEEDAHYEALVSDPRSEDRRHLRQEGNMLQNCAIHFQN